MTKVTKEQKQQIETKLLKGEQIYVPFWEENAGVIKMRELRTSTKPDTKERMHGARMAFPDIKNQWESVAKGLLGHALPKPMKDTMNNLFNRIRTDQKYARFAYNAFPVIADRFGYGKQVNGQDRLSFADMKTDLLCRRLMQGAR